MRVRSFIAWLVVLGWCLIVSGSGYAADTNGNLKISWAKNMLKIEGPEIPGGALDVWYLEAFCRSGSTDRDWNETVILHKTELQSADADGHLLRLKTLVGPKVEILHEIKAGKDDSTFNVTVVNRGDTFADVQWFQPCMRVGTFTGMVQSNYHSKCFIFTTNGLTMLDQVPRTEPAR